ncbi:glycosyltransferase family 2 protein [Trueperella bialowiezensis]|uniref:Transferase 2, rSAM/selenodomain-associated n=1 Tax=Trueperella bialowiezensis TaxID=312285 RepID=A0A3S4WFS4_9ACTO|nr:glycosyltransferase family 2 protein [Trueperella bialowiezensis]VEI12902.1 transferase 2, rSAM/selenodomain-associated [Trueperella bialowiezensis]
MNLAREKVTAIVVSHARDLSYLDRTLAALAAQTHEPDEIVVVLPNLDADAVQPVHTHLDTDSEHVSIKTASGDNLAQITAEVDTGDADWLWLVHADSAPEPDALDALLRTGESSKRVAIVGPKQIAWEDADAPIVLEVGIRATRTARRVPEIEPDERDQGQYDSRTDVLAVGTAGMLVRAEAWEKLGGLDPHLGPFGDGLEFSRRARRAGYRVVVEPQAVVRHARAGLGEADESFAPRRAAQLYNALLAAPGPALVFMVVYYLIAGLGRAVARLVFKEPGLAWAELKAVAGMLGLLPAVRQGRRRIAKVATVGPDALAELEAKPADIRAARRQSRRSRKEAKMMAEQPDPLTLKARADLAMHTRRGAVLTAFIAVAFAIVFHLPTASSGVLSGGGLAEDPIVGTELARLAWRGWLDSGAGYPAPLDPLWVTTLPVLLLGQPFGLTLGALATAMVYAAIPLAAMFAYLGAGRLSKSWIVRTVAAGVWMVAPSFIDALHTGQIGAITAHTLLPLVVWSVVGAWRGSASALGLATLTFGVVASAVPVYALVALAVALAGVAFHSGRRLRWLWLPVPALLALAPTLSAVLRHSCDDVPSALVRQLLFAQSGVPVGAGSSTAMIDAILADQWAWIPLAIICGGAVLALLRIHRMWWIRFGWLIATAGILHASAAASTTIATRPVSGGWETVAGSPTIGLSLAWLGIWLATGYAAHALRTAMRKRNFGATQIIGGLTMLALPVATVVLGGRWLTAVYDAEQVLGDHGPGVPALAVEATTKHERVLALTMDDAVQAHVWRGQGYDLHEYAPARQLATLQLTGPEPAAGTEQVAQPDSDLATEHLETAVLGLLGGSETAASELAQHSISVVLVPAEHSSEQARNELVGRLQAVPGLQYVSDGETGAFWRVTAPTDRVYAEDAITASGVVGGSGEIMAGQARELRLSERANPRWQATVAGQKLEPVGTAWYQAWHIPAGTHGPLVVSYNDPLHRALTFSHMAVLVASFVMSLPIRRRKGGVE